MHLSWAAIGDGMGSVIHDHLSRIETYRPLSAPLARALDFVRDTDLASLATGRHEVDGERVYALIFEYATALDPSARWESHRRYIDLQLVLAGEERILVADVATLGGPGAYDDARDVTFYESAGASQSVALTAGQFVILFPHDGHRATFALNGPGTVRKLVVKVTAEDRL